MADTADAQPPIGDHGVIGDMETLALVTSAGDIDWLCWPRFDSAALFGRLLDPGGGGWSVAPTCEHRPRQLYLPDTNLLITRFHTDDGLVELIDFMSVVDGDRCLVRELRGVTGRVPVRSRLAARPDYGRRALVLDHDQHGVRVGLGDDTVLHTASVELEVDGDDIVADVELVEGDRVVFGLGATDATPVALDDGRYEATADHWRTWIDRSSYRGRWREVVHRSALVLKLLTHGESGGLLAAGTTSLPEALGGGRNWDYRFVWVRDAAFTLYAFLELGFEAEAAAFTGWLQERIRGCATFDGPPLRPLYDLDGDADLDESVLDHWSGYAGSGPVRVGNAASSQVQLDIYGEIIDSLYLADRLGEGLSLQAWDDVCTLADHVCEHWHEPDDGMWEARSGAQRYTSSLLMCWVALERAVRMATRRGRPADLERWRRVRDQIHTCIREEAWNEELGAFTQTLGGSVLDASVLLMPLVKFIPPDDPQWLSTLDAIDRHLAHDVLVDRYDQDEVDDGLDGPEGSFGICSFWYVEALARAGRLEAARTAFDKLITYAGPLGLHSEMIGPTGEQLGNYPQAFTHLALISAAVHLDELLDAVG